MHGTFVFTVLSLTTYTSVYAVLTTENESTLSPCEQEMMKASAASNNLWVQEITRFYSKSQNVDRPFDLTFYVRCYGEKINRLDPGCRRVTGMLLDAANTWFRYVKNYLPLRFVAIDSSNDTKASWINKNYGVDVDFPDSNREHTDFGHTCPFKKNTLAHASAITLHMNMLQPWSFSDRPMTESYDVYSTIVHEMGHVFGLSHASERDSVMFPTTRSNETKSPTVKDFKTFERLYENAINERYRQKQSIRNKSRQMYDEERLIRRTTQMVLYRLQKVLYEAQRL